MAQTKQTYTNLKQKLLPSHKFIFETSYSKSGRKLLLAQNNDLDSPLFLGVKKRRALGSIKYTQNPNFNIRKHAKNEILF